MLENTEKEKCTIIIELEGNAAKYLRRLVEVTKAQDDVSISCLVKTIFLGGLISYAKIVGHLFPD